MLQQTESGQIVKTCNMSIVPDKNTKYTLMQIFQFSTVPLVEVEIMCLC